MTVLMWTMNHLGSNHDNSDVDHECFDGSHNRHETNLDSFDADLMTVFYAGHDLSVAHHDPFDANHYSFHAEHERFDKDHDCVMLSSMRFLFDALCTVGPPLFLVFSHGR
jgi:hypothetical protein